MIASTAFAIWTQLLEERDPRALLLLVAAFLPALYLSSFCHEVGHVLLGRWSGYRITSMGMGLARPLIVWNWGKTRVYLAWKKPLQGITFSLKLGPSPKRWQRIASLAGGVLANALLAIIAFVLWVALPWGSGLWFVLWVINGLNAVTNLIPFKVWLGHGYLQTDGAQILQTLCGRISAPTAPERVQKLEGLRGLWTDIGDHLMLRLHLLEAAVAWKELDDLEQAEALYHEAEALRTEDSPWLRAVTALVQFEIALGTRRYEEAAAALDTAEAIYVGLKYELGPFVAAWGRAELLLRQGDAATACQQLDALVAEAPPAARRLTGTAILAARLRARAALGDAEAVQALRVEHEKQWQRQTVLTRDLAVRQALARFHVRREEWTQAEEAYRQAVGGAEQLLARFVRKEDQERFARCQASLLSELAECLRRQNRAEEAEQVPKQFLSVEAMQRRPEEVQRLSNRRNLRWGVALTLLNLAVAFVLVNLVIVLDLWAKTPAVVHLHGGLSFELPPAVTIQGYLRRMPLYADARLGGNSGLLLVLLAFSPVLVGLYNGARFLWARLRTRKPMRTGKVTLYLAGFPWLAWLGSFLFDFLW
jgi:tetratricopeptide (TPR) repeat protein